MLDHFINLLGVLVVGVLAFLFVGGTTISYARLVSYAGMLGSTSAYITDLDVQSSGDGGSSYAFTYEYTVDDIQYSGYAREITKTFHVGDVVTVHYKEDSPETCMLVVEHYEDWITLVLCGGNVIFWIGVLLVGRHNKKKRKKRKRRTREM